jgi:hypothetical protein
MILNAYAVLDAFLCLFRLGTGLLVLWLGLGAWLAWRRRTPGAEDRTLQENHYYLLILLANLQLVLNVVAWPIYYLLLQSYVVEWPGIMCIYGVTQIGAESVSLSRFLPALVTFLEVTKPALVFLSGGWFVLYLVNRGTRTGPLLGRVLIVLLGAGFLAVADAAVEGAYLVIPKKEIMPSTGCCTTAFDSRGGISRWLPESLVGENDNLWLYFAYYAVNIGMVLALAFRRHFRGPAHLVLLLGAAVSLALNAVFLVEVFAPRLLHLPYHHCPYDLVPGAPESLVAVALFLGGCFSVGWACMLQFLGDNTESAAHVPRMVNQLLYLGLLGYLGSVVMISVELVLACLS